MDENKSYFMGAGLGALGLLLVIFLTGLIVVYTGAYNVAASEDHTPVVRWAFTTTLHNSVSRRAADIQAPETFSEARVEAGAAEYKAMCQHCHAGPGREREAWASGMLPQPPHLTDAAAHWEPAEIFWIVQNGLKMAGMPAFGSDHGEEALWNIAAFVNRLPGMTAEQYRQF